MPPPPPSTDIQISISRTHERVTLCCKGDQGRISDLEIILVYLSGCRLTICVLKGINFSQLWSEEKRTEGKRRSMFL